MNNGALFRITDFNERRTVLEILTTANDMLKERLLTVGAAISIRGESLKFSKNSKIFLMQNFRDHFTEINLQHFENSLIIATITPK
jgi:hypothetical protein